MAEKINNDLLLETVRLKIKLFSLDDAPFILKLLNSPGWLENIGTRNIQNIDDAKVYIYDKIITSYNTHGFGFYKVVLKSTGVTVGMCGFAKRSYLDDSDIGFAFLPEYEGKGYAYESAVSCMDYAKNVLKWNNITAITVKENMRSIKLLEKLNLKFDNMIRPDEDKEELMLFTGIL